MRTLENRITILNFHTLHYLDYRIIDCRKDFEFPSVSTLTRITSSCGNQSTSVFLNNVLSFVDIKKEACVLLPEEILREKSLQFHGEKYLEKQKIIRLSSRIPC